MTDDLLETTAAPPLRILFVIRSLGVGGAERQLAILAIGLRARGHDVTVCTTYDGGERAEELRAGHVRMISLGKRSRWDAWRTVAGLIRVTRDVRPDVVHGYMPTSNLLSTVAGFITRRSVVWGVRASVVDWSAYDWLARASFRATSLLSRQPALIICNSVAGLEFHARHGYPRERMRHIPNGIDPSRFRPDAAARARQRAAWGVVAHESLIGIVARLDRMKDHGTFLDAARRLVDTGFPARFVCIGAGDARYASALRERAAALGLDERLRWIDDAPDLVAAYNALDVHVSATRLGEGFSNVIGEAMACGVPCVATDVGDATAIIGDTGRLVPPGDSDAIARACRELLSSQPRAVGIRARARIEREFGVERLVLRSETALRSVTRR